VLKFQPCNRLKLFCLSFKGQIRVQWTKNHSKYWISSSQVRMVNRPQSQISNPAIGSCLGPWETPILQISASQSYYSARYGQQSPLQMNQFSWNFAKYLISALLLCGNIFRIFGPLFGRGSSPEFLIVPLALSTIYSGSNREIAWQNAGKA